MFASFDSDISQQGHFIVLTLNSSVVRLKAMSSLMMIYRDENQLILICITANLAAQPT